VNYRRIYEALMDKARSRDLFGYCETHHVVPKCIGGSDCDGNLVRLTAREHYIAHLLLVKLHPANVGLVFAAHMMTVDRHGRRVGNRKYEWLRKRHSEATSKSKRGNTYKFGMKHSDETRRKISKANKGKSYERKPHSLETKKKISGRLRGIVRPEALRERFSKDRLSKENPGVSARKNGSFVVRKRVEGKRKYLGFFWSLEEANRAYASA
jgi:hypothetical protein